jgi:Glu-tRNA(Gln) amidotransferase subunit E-like FAD-binding protein
MNIMSTQEMYTVYPILFPIATRIPENSSMSQILGAIKTQVETYENITYFRYNIVNLMVTRYSHKLSDEQVKQISRISSRNYITDEQVDEILEIFSDDQRKLLITNLNNGERWF